MSRIIAAIFDDSATADGAMEQLRASGFAPDAVDSFALNAPGQHHGLPMGGDKDADVGATGAGHGALTGAAVGSVVGAAAGIAAATLLGPVAIAGGLAAGAYAGSLAGAVGTMGDDKPAAAPTKEERPAGIMVAAAVRADQDGTPRSGSSGTPARACSSGRTASGAMATGSTSIPSCRRRGSSFRRRSSGCPTSGRDAAPVIQPRPTKGIFVAITVMNCTLASSGRLAMCTTALATWTTSISGSIAISPFA